MSALCIFISVDEVPKYGSKHRKYESFLNFQLPFFKLINDPSRPHEQCGIFRLDSHIDAWRHTPSSFVFEGPSKQRILFILTWLFLKWQLFQFVESHHLYNYCLNIIYNFVCMSFDFWSSICFICDITGPLIDYK